MISAGGTSLLITMVVFGLLANFARREPQAAAALQAGGGGRMAQFLGMRHSESPGTSSPRRGRRRRRADGRRGRHRRRCGGTDRGAGCPSLRRRRIPSGRTTRRAAASRPAQPTGTARSRRAAERSGRHGRAREGDRSRTRGTREPRAIRRGQRSVERGPPAPVEPHAGGQPRAGRSRAGQPVGGQPTRPAAAAGQGKAMPVARSPGTDRVSPGAGRAGGAARDECSAGRRRHRRAHRTGAGGSRRTDRRRPDRPDHRAGHRARAGDHPGAGPRLRTAADPGGAVAAQAVQGSAHPADPDARRDQGHPGDHGRTRGRRRRRLRRVRRAARLPGRPRPGADRHPRGECDRRPGQQDRRQVRGVASPPRSTARGCKGARVVGNPVRRSLSELDRAGLRPQAREFFGLDPRRADPAGVRRVAGRAADQRRGRAAAARPGGRPGSECCTPTAGRTNVTVPALPAGARPTSPCRTWTGWIWPTRRPTWCWPGPVR